MLLVAGVLAAPAQAGPVPLVAFQPTTDGTTPSPTPAGGTRGQSTSGDDPPPQIAVSKRANRHSVAAGDSIVFTIVVRNPGDVAVGGVVACDDPGRGLAIERVPDGASLRGGRLCWNVGRLDPGERTTLRARMRVVAPRDAGRVRNVVRASGRRATDQPADATVPVDLSRQAVAAAGERAG